MRQGNIRLYTLKGPVGANRGLVERAKKEERMDFIEFCEDVLEHPLSDWQKTYLNNMYDMVKTAKEENKEVNIIMPGRGSSKGTRIHIAALLLVHEYGKYLKGEKDG